MKQRGICCLIIKENTDQAYYILVNVFSDACNKKLIITIRNLVSNLFFDHIVT